MNTINAFLADEQGADLIEYALLVGLVALALTTTLSGVATSITGLFDKITTALGKVNP
jgi:Flp pilus assembly pilin Flp